MVYEESIAEQGNKYERYREDNPSEWQQAVLDAGFELPLNLHETLPDYYDRLCAVDSPLPEHLHPDFFVTAKVLEWLDRQEIAQPFYLHIGLLSPHDLYDPPKRFLDMYNDEDIPMPDVTDEELAGIPDELFAAGRQNELRDYTTNLRPSHATPESIRRLRKHYYASVTMIDEKLGEIVDKLKSKGLYDNAIIIFTSDHGDNLFDHGLFYKGELYDTITHIPLMIKSPEGIHPGVIRSDIVSHLDVAQFILEKAGVEGNDLDGISLVPVVEQGAIHTRKRVFAEEGASGLRPEPDLIAMMRTEDYKLIHFVGSKNGQLYDLKEDPFETRNLWNRPEYHKIQCTLTRDMLDWLYGNLFKHRDLFINAR
jgi:arylsulfatase A-like enzyme